MKFYELDDKIANCFDEETGECINEEAFNALALEKDKKIESIACWIKEIDSDAEAIEKEEKALAARRKSKEKKSEYLKTYLKYILYTTSFESARCKITFRKSTSVNITDEGIIPNDYKQAVVTIKIDKVALKEALKGGELINGAELIENQNIQIK